MLRSKKYDLTRSQVIYESSISAGFGYIPTLRNNDMFGFAINKANIMAITFGDIEFDYQYIAEIYYRAQVTPWLQISPSLQVLSHTAVNLGAVESGDVGNVFIKDKTDVVLGIQARFMF